MGRPLPPAVITEDLLKRVADAIPTSLRPHTTWNVGFGREAVSEVELDALLLEIKDETHFDELFLEVRDTENSAHAFELSCESDSLWISYNIAEARDTDFRKLADRVETLFKRNKRLRSRIPRQLRLWGCLRGPTFRIGSAQTSILSQLNWANVVQDTISRFVAHTITLFLGLLVGWLVGKFGPDFW